MKSVIIIPARYSSSRYPGKPLVKILGKPLIIWTAETCAKAIQKQNVYIATDDNRIKDVVESYGFTVILTSKNALTGTDRLAEITNKVEGKFAISTNKIASKITSNIAGSFKSNFNSNLTSDFTNNCAGNATTNFTSNF